MKTVGGVIIALLLLTLPAFAQYDLGHFGDDIVVPQERLGLLSLGMSREAVHARLGKPDFLGASFIPGNAWDKFVWDWPQVLGRVDKWNNLGVVAGNCYSNNRVFVLLATYVNNKVDNAGRVRYRVDKITTPEGLNVERYRLAHFVRAYGKPEGKIPTIGGFNNPIYIFANRLVVIMSENSDSMWAIGTVDPDICMTGQADLQRYYPFLGRGVRVGPTFFSAKGDEGKGEIGEPILVAGPIPKFGAKQPIYVGVDVIAAKWAIGHEVPFSRQWSCTDGPTARWNFKRTIQQGKSGEGTVRLVGGINMRDRRAGRCTIRFIVGPDTELASAQFMLD